LLKNKEIKKKKAEKRKVSELLEEKLNNFIL
jgi:hypothetical protein